MIQRNDSGKSAECRLQRNKPSFACGSEEEIHICSRILRILDYFFVFIMQIERLPEIVQAFNGEPKIHEYAALCFTFYYISSSMNFMQR